MATAMLKQGGTRPPGAFSDGGRVARELTLAERETVAHHANDLARMVRVRAVELRQLCGPAMMPAEAMTHLDNARFAVDRLMHEGGALTDAGISLRAMRAVQQMRQSLDDFSREVERWRVAMPGEEFPESVLNGLALEMGRATQLHFRALTLNV